MIVPKPPDSASTDCETFWLCFLTEITLKFSGVLNWNLSVFSLSDWRQFSSRPPRWQTNSGQPQSVNRAALWSVSTQKHSRVGVFMRADLWFPQWGAHILLSQSHNKTDAHLYNMFDDFWPENIRHGFPDPKSSSWNMFERWFIQNAVQSHSLDILIVLWVKTRSIQHRTCDQLLLCQEYEYEMSVSLHQRQLQPEALCFWVSSTFLWTRYMKNTSREFHLNMPQM